MLFRAASTLAVLALAGQAVAEPLRQPYKVKLASMSARQIFGLDRRDNAGYSPEQEICGSGDTCAEACGKGFAQCASNDGVVHCFNKGGNQTCCPGKTGDSCDEGYFCSADADDATWCCPDTMDLEECAKAYNLPTTALSSATATATATTSTSSTSSASSASSTSTSSAEATPNVETQATTTSDSVSVAESATSKAVTPGATTLTSAPAITAAESGECTTYTSAVVETIVQTSSLASTTALPTTLIAPTDTPTKTTPSATTPAAATSSIAQGGASGQGPLNSLVLLVAGAFAALL